MTRLPRSAMRRLGLSNASKGSASLDTKPAERALRAGKCLRRCPAGHLYRPRGEEAAEQPCPRCASQPEPIGPIVRRVMATLDGQRKGTAA